MSESTDIGKRLALCRQRSGETLDQVSEAVGISYVALARYEGGHRMPKADILSRLADHYATTVDALLGKPARGESAEADEAFAIRDRLRRDPDYRTLFDAASNASQEHIRAAAEMLKALEKTRNAH